MIKRNGNGEQVYFDKNGEEITEGCHVRYASGRVETVYRTEDGQLGTDATNPDWIKTDVPAPVSMASIHSITVKRRRLRSPSDSEEPEQISREPLLRSSAAVSLWRNIRVYLP